MTTIKKISSSLYSLIPTLLELDDVVCGEFKKMFKKLIVDLITDITNINNDEPMLYEKNIHHLNAINVIRAFNACIYCLINKLKGDGIFSGPYVKECTEIPEDTEDSYLESDNIVSVLQDTFNIMTPSKDEDTAIIPTDIPREISVPRRVSITPSNE